MSEANEHVEPSDSRCPVCGHEKNTIVDAKVKGVGDMRTLAIKSCNKCETLWGEPKEWWGVVDGK